MQTFQISIYELLVRRGCPEAIAELIASRCDEVCKFTADDTIRDICVYGFDWSNQPETETFWHTFTAAIEAEEKVMYPKMED